MCHPEWKSLLIHPWYPIGYEIYLNFREVTLLNKHSLRIHKRWHVLCWTVSSSQEVTVPQCLTSPPRQNSFFYFPNYLVSNFELRERESWYIWIAHYTLWSLNFPKKFKNQAGVGFFLLYLVSPRCRDVIWYTHGHNAKLGSQARSEIHVFHVHKIPETCRLLISPSSSWGKPCIWLENKVCFHAPVRSGMGSLFHPRGSSLSMCGACSWWWGVCTHQDYLNRPLSGSKVTHVNDRSINPAQLMLPPRSWLLLNVVVFT